MKKILNEWRKFVNETKPKHPPKKNPANPFDRAKTSFVQNQPSIFQILHFLCYKTIFWAKTGYLTNIYYFLQVYLWWKFSKTWIPMEMGA